MVPVCPVSIANSEKMTMGKTKDVRISQVCVLILLERIAVRDAAFRREGELGDHVKYL